MNRVEFTSALNILLSNMLANGERPKQGLAVDIYFIGFDWKLTDPKLGWEYVFYG